MSVGANFFGRGTSLPLDLGVDGGIREAAGAAAIHQSILTILATQHGERVMRPTFGCNLRALAFAPNNAATAALARHYVEDGLSLWEPRIEVLQVDVQNDQEAGALRITVHYRLRATQEPGTLVYPFYLESR
jgi:phage baseplate assembly protein W